MMRRKNIHSNRRIALPTSIIIKIFQVQFRNQGPRLPKLKMKRTIFSIEGSLAEVAEYLISQSREIVEYKIIRGPRTSFQRMMHNKPYRLPEARSASAMRDFRKPQLKKSRGRCSGREIILLTTSEPKTKNTNRMMMINLTSRSSSRSSNQSPSSTTSKVVNMREVQMLSADHLVHGNPTKKMMMCGRVTSSLS